MGAIDVWAQRRAKRAALEKLKLTEEEKQRWARMMVETWQAIAPDALQACRDCGQRVTTGIVVEYVCDANRMAMFAGMWPEEEEFFSVVWSRPAGKRWIYSVLRGYAR
jgi:hypothetical protein